VPSVLERTTITREAELPGATLQSASQQPPIQSKSLLQSRLQVSNHPRWQYHVILSTRGPCRANHIYVLMMKLLLAPLGTLAAVAILAIGASMQVRATPEECVRALAGDNLIPLPIGSVNHAITIRRPPSNV
jgi:hypothetical protein